MRLLASLFLIVGMAAGVRAQQPSGTQESSAVVVLKFSWAKELFPGWEKRAFPVSFEPYETTRAPVGKEARMPQPRNPVDKALPDKREREVTMRQDASVPKQAAQTKERPRDGYRYKVTVQNNGAKTIKAIDWDYIFYDLDTQQEISRLEFTSEERISPGKVKEVTVFILAPPTRIVSAGALSKKKQLPFKEQVALVRITYSDGSVWERP